MSDYGVPADSTDALPWTWAQQRLIDNKNYWVVTVSASGRPHALPVWGVWLPETDRFWFSCSPNARKARNIAENAQCVVTVDDTVECVSVEGIAGPMTDDEARSSAAVEYAAKYAPPDEREAMSAFVLSHAVFAVRPVKAVAIIEREEEFATKATRWTW